MRYSGDLNDIPRQLLMSPAHGTGLRQLRVEVTPNLGGTSVPLEGFGFGSWEDAFGTRRPQLNEKAFKWWSGYALYESAEGSRRSRVPKKTSLAAFLAVNNLPCVVILHISISFSKASLSMKYRVTNTSPLGLSRPQCSHPDRPSTTSLPLPPHHMLSRPCPPISPSLPTVPPLLQRYSTASPIRKPLVPSFLPSPSDCIVRSLFSKQSYLARMVTSLSTDPGYEVEAGPRRSQEVGTLAFHPSLPLILSVAA